MSTKIRSVWKEAYVMRELYLGLKRFIGDELKKSKVSALFTDFLRVFTINSIFCPYNFDKFLSPGRNFD
ncbi:hypothetical protein OUZ56_006097 [Daphnia magna]|uniref:Uncharacterized protein n=1 Tax=Daphnia magna TaxID=35525 RepID=A0ABQ9YW14_9CRUS|nr:hypothetical protein OUZ56_006097 [Daphnia magna]